MGGSKLFSMLSASTLRGAFTALVTPFRKDLSIDEVRLRALVDWQIKSGIDGLVPAATTGEGATLSHAEHRRVIDIVIDEADGRVPVIADAGSNNTVEAVELAEHAKKSGADAILCISPYYTKPTQDGIIAHYRKIASVGVPLVLYNVPGRTSRNVEAETTLALARHPNIIGIKEASGNLKQIAAIIDRKPKSFAVLSGEDAQTLSIIRLGGTGTISVVSNEIPAETHALVAAALSGNYTEATKIHKKYLDLMNVNFVDCNPIDVKWALAAMNKIAYGCRLPLTEPSAVNKKKIVAVLKKHKLV